MKRQHGRDQAHLLAWGRVVAVPEWASNPDAWILVLGMSATALAAPEVAIGIALAYGAYAAWDWWDASRAHRGVKGVPVQTTAMAATMVTNTCLPVKFGVAGPWRCSLTGAAPLPT